MSLRINTNVAALNSYNNLSANQSRLEASFQQLSSGLRINKAADDAAGLSIAQGLTSQINGLTQAVSNANDGINVAQIADGALGTTQDILQRMRGLIVKAGNEGTQDSKSLGAIQQEIQNLNTQLNNIADQTKFGQTNLLDGSYNKNFQVGANGNDTIRLDLSGAAVTSNALSLNKLNVVVGTNVSGVAFTAANAGVLSPTHADVAAKIDGMFDTALGAAAYTVASAAGGGEGWEVSTGGNVVGTITGGESGRYTVADSAGNVLGQIDTTTYESNFEFKAALNLTSGATFDAIQGWLGATADTVIDNGDGTWSIGSDASTKVGNMAKNSDGTYTVTNMAGATVGVLNTTPGAAPTAGVLSYSSAQATADLDTLNVAIGTISEARSQIGAVQNQLGYTVSNLQTAITNVTASRSNLTDADLAQQVTAMTQSQILTQAATSVLAQANSAPQAILKLLQ